MFEEATEMIQVNVRREDHNSREYGYGLYVNGYVVDTDVDADRPYPDLVFASERLPRDASEAEIKAAEKRVRDRAWKRYLREKRQGLWEAHSPPRSDGGGIMGLWHVAVDPAWLSNIPVLEKRLGGKFIGAEIQGDKAVVEILPVADLRFWVDVRDLRGEIYLEYGGRTEPLDEIMEDYDHDLAEQLIARVVEQDNGGAFNMSGQYFPTSDESVVLFERLMESAKPITRGLWPR